MSGAQLLLTALLIAALLGQALVPTLRVLLVIAGAGLSCFAATLLGVGTTGQIFAEIPWDVLILLVGLGLLSEVLVASRLFGVLALLASRRSRGEPRRVILWFALAMYVVSGLVNNLTALFLVLPVLLALLQLLGADQRYVSWTLGVVLIACNLGGAATPIGDFPALLLLGSGAMEFPRYLAHAAPPTALALGLLLVVVLLLVRPERALARTPLTAQLSQAVMQALHRNVRLDRRLVIPTLGVLGVMVLAWVAVPARSGVSAELIGWLGVAVVLSLRARLGERLLRTRVDVEAVLFLLALFVMVGAVRRTGLFGEVARLLTALPVAPLWQLLAFLLLAGLLTGMFSAGPSMAATLEVAHALAHRLPATAVYVGLALSVCAGSSLFLTAATSGPMAQALTERAGLQDHGGRPLRFGFLNFLPVGLTGFVIIQGVAMLYALLLVLAAPS